MIDKQTEELINERLDGILPHGSESQLDDLLSRNTDARAYDEDLKRIRGALEQAALEEEVPPEIMAVVMQTVSEMRPSWQAATTQETPHGFRAFFSGFRKRPVLAGGLTFASGFALGLATLSVLHPGASGDSHALPGFMAPAALHKSALLARETIAFPGLSGFIESRLANQDVIVHIDLHSDARVEVTMGYEGDLLRPKGFQLAEPALEDVALGPNELRFSHRGANSYVFVFRKPGLKSDLRLRFQGEGGTFEKRLPTSER